MKQETVELYRKAAKFLDRGKVGDYLREQNDMGGYSLPRNIFDKEMDKFEANIPKKDLKDFDRTVLWNQLMRELRYYGPQPMII